MRVWPDREAPLFGACRVRLRLFDPQGAQVLEHTSKPFSQYGVYLQAKYVLEETLPVAAPQLWCCETPALYTLTLEMLDEESRCVDVESCRVGFREVRIQNGMLELNRKRLIVRGANLHEHSATTGRTVSPGAAGTAAENEGLKLQRRAHLPLSQGQPVLRLVRRAGPLRGGRNQPGDPRLWRRPQR